MDKKRWHCTLIPNDFVELELTGDGYVSVLAMTKVKYASIVLSNEDLLDMSDTIKNFLANKLLDIDSL